MEYLAKFLEGYVEEYLIRDIYSAPASAARNCIYNGFAAKYAARYALKAQAPPLIPLVYAALVEKE